MTKNDQHARTRMVLAPSLEEKMQAGHCVAFVGAGFSMACGMPSWGKLLSGLLDAAREDQATSDAARLASYCQYFTDKGNFAMAANLLRELTSIDELHQRVRQRFDLSVFHSAPKAARERMKQRMRNLIRTPWAGIITTNYDELIEYAFSQWRRDSVPTATTADPGLGSILKAGSSGGVFFVKLHGTITSGPIVLSSDEYDRTYLVRPQVTAFLTAAMFKYHLVFIGCSLEDEILRLRRRLVEEHQGRIPLAYALLPDSEENQGRRTWLKNRAAIEMLAYPNDRGHSGVDRFLRRAGECESAGRAGVDSISEMTRLSTSERLHRIGATNLEILSFMMRQPRHELPHLRLVNLGDAATGLSRSFELMSPDERVYRVFFLVSIGLLKEVRDADGRRIYHVPPATARIIRSFS